MWKNEPACAERYLIRILNKMKGLARTVIGQDNSLARSLAPLKKFFQTRSEIEAILAGFANVQDQVYFVQIGAADGISNDPLFHLIKTKKWKGILVEPVPYLYDKLQHNYADCTDLIFENVAISNKEEIRDFWFPQNINGQPEWFYQLGSFSRDVILKHADAIPDLDKMIDRVSLPCISLSSLLKRNKITKFDVLLIDTEGYDFEIIKQIDFSFCKPKIIIYEHKHLKTQDQKACLHYLKEHGYQLTEEQTNTLAFQSVSP
ncbi:MAG: FkbM family methyltransferase [Candidatus Obscuribacterales bacterium]|nr:FkbM family methyltransferase [Candidatus Obscuribacterales bacterium]